jgi:hypothetical protein
MLKPVLWIRDILVRIRIRICRSVGYLCIRVLLFSSVTFKTIKRHKEVTNQWESRFFLLFLLDNRRIRGQIRIRTLYCTNGFGTGRPKNIHVGTDPMDPDQAPDPQHWLKLMQIWTHGVHMGGFLALAGLVSLVQDNIFLLGWPSRLVPY